MLSILIKTETVWRYVVVKNIKNILWLYKPNWEYGKIFVVLSLFFWLILEPGAELINVYLPSIIVDFLTNGKDFNEIVSVVIIFQVLLMSKPMYENIFNMFCKNKMLAKIEMKLKRDIYVKALKTDYKYIDDPQYYDQYCWAINEYANKSAEAQNLVNHFLYSLLTLISMITIIATISPIAVAIIIICGIVENALHSATNYFDVKKDEAIIPWDRRLEYFHRLFYLRDYATDLKSTNLSNHVFKHYEHAENNKLSIIKNFAFKMIGWALSANLTYYIAHTFLMLNIAYKIYSKDIYSVGTYITAMMAVQRLADAAGDLFYHIKDGSKLGLYATKIRSFFDIQSSIETEDNKNMDFPKGNLSLEFCNVCFKYENSDFSLNNFNLKISPGEKIAIVGENGVGKSTLVKLLLRLYDLNEGTILINGKDIREFDVNDIRKNIGVSFQNSNIYALSLKENLQLYNKTSEENLYNIIKKMNLEAIFKKGNVTLETELTKEFDENGIMLSGGEIQKVGIARLLIGDFGLLLLDEPSSALDPLAEYEMTKLILDSSNRTTTIMISHRLSTIRNADRIVLVDAGQVKEVGTHDELMAKKGKYFEMFTKQAENYNL